MRRITSAASRCLSLAFAASSPCFGADVSADLRIDRVTVYREDGALTRTGDVSLSAGSDRLIVRGLPAAIDPKTLSVTVEGESVQSVRHYDSVEYPSGRELEETAADSVD